METREPCAIVPLLQADEAALVRIVRSLLGPVTGPRIVVATAPESAAEVRHSLASADLVEVAVVVARTPGSRSQALTAGLEHLGVDVHSAAPVLVADHRFPLATGVVADRVIAGLRDGRAVVVPAVPVTDTVKTVDELGSVLGTVDRERLRTVQYPRGFAAAVLWNLLSDDDLPAADEFAAALRAGFAVTIVDGDPHAVAVELPRDAQLLAAISAAHPD